MVLLALPRYSGQVLTEYVTILQQPGIEQITRCSSSGSILVGDLLNLLEVAMVLAISNLTYHYVELKGIEVGRRLARCQPRPLLPVWIGPDE
ncbi:hypothetical protein DQ403_21635 [Stutzerimonas zhaodongensis]|jgi:peptidoglycan/LPS O-acetylase OafA/YrhL|uniref:Uncharacterized protein n=1 Tax=Stutzerimonas zhaodongensis TaxID=1176257 RepID=A0A365PP91_9GAMM|nr:hypothetical protein DQ403_21635 [Stutzerimonas zhaodongensis]